MAETTHAAEFLEALTAAKEKLKEEGKRAGKKEAKEKPLPEKTKKKKTEKKPKDLKKEPSKEKEIREKLAEISIEKEAEKIPAKPARPLPPKFVPPIYKRPLPQLPPTPKVIGGWPLRPPKPPARPPEEEAAAPPIVEVPVPLAPKVPVPARSMLNLGKLNPLIADATITTIQCDGANIQIKIIRAGRIEESTIILSEEEIKSIIKAFSDASSQTITEPMFKASAAGFTISANISAFTGSRFVVVKG